MASVISNFLRHDALRHDAWPTRAGRLRGPFVDSAISMLEYTFCLFLKNILLVLIY